MVTKTDGVKVIFFDLDDVLLSTKGYSDREMSQYLNVEDDTFNRVSQSLYDDDRLNDRWSNLESLEEENQYYHDFYRLLMLRLGLPADKNKVSHLLDLRMRRKRNRKLTKQAVSILNYLKKNYQLGIISNAPPSRREVELRSLGVENLFSPVVLSCEVGYKKPDNEIFKIALKLASINGSQAAFIDNEIENVLAARDCDYGLCILLGDEIANIDGVVRINELQKLKEIL